MSQEQRQQVNNNFNSLIENLGLVKPGSVTNFTFVYEGSPRIESVKPSCSCTNLSVEDLDDGRQLVTGAYTAPEKQSMSTMYKQYRIGSDGYQWTIKGEWAIPSDMTRSNTPLNKITGVDVPLLTSSIQVSFDDGETEETVDETRVRKVNGSKLRTNLTVQALGDLR